MARLIARRRFSHLSTCSEGLVHGSEGKRGKSLAVAVAVLLCYRKAQVRATDWALGPKCSYLRWSAGLICSVLSSNETGSRRTADDAQRAFPGLPRLARLARLARHTRRQARANEREVGQARHHLSWNRRRGARPGWGCTARVDGVVALRQLSGKTLSP